VLGEQRSDAQLDVLQLARDSAALEGGALLRSEIGLEAVAQALEARGVVDESAKAAPHR
jgi:hypothetical protein